MHRLVVNPGTASSWEIPLPAGVTSLGRARENSFPIDHDSVSDSHCQITVLNSGVILKDLGSGSGTFVDDKPAKETVLLPGQNIRIGDVSMRFEAGDNWVAAPVISLPANARCKFHPQAFARFICPNCHVTCCDLCVHTRAVDGRPAIFCRTCSVECTPLPAPTAPVAETRNFIRELSGVFAYPFKGDGKIVVLAGTVILFVLDVIARFSSVLGILVGLFSAGFLVCYMQRVLVSSATGEKKVPDLPDISNFEDIAQPMLQFFSTVLICFGPALVLPSLVTLRVLDPAQSPWLRWALPGSVIAGCVVFPMAYTAVSVFNSLAALNPILIAVSILRIPLEYLLVAALFVTVFVIGGMGSHWLSQIIPIPFLPGVVTGFSSLYLMTVEMRMLGVLYGTKQEELGWFDR